MCVCMHTCVLQENGILESTTKILISHFLISTCRQDNIVSKHVISQHQLKVIGGNDDEDWQKHTIRRAYLYEDAVRAFSPTSFNVSKVLKVYFIGEKTVDDGSPRREFFALLIKEVLAKSCLFAGWPNNVVPLHNVEAVAANKFYIIGKMITTCLVQGGEPPVFFAEAVAEYIINGEINCTPCIEIMRSRKN